MIAVCAMLCGAGSFVEFEQFGNARFEFSCEICEIAFVGLIHSTTIRMWAKVRAFPFL
jgi:hypothetical protein